MRLRLLGICLLGTGSLLATACAVDAPEATTAPSELGEFSPYPYELRDIRALSPFDPQNASIADFGSAARDQGKIASCASHGFLGLVENQLWNDKGVSLDLSERFMLYANFMSTRNMGDQPSVIARFPATAERWGVLHESVYPYAAIADNASRFSQDAAQGLSTDPNAMTVDKALEGTNDASRERSAVLERGEFLGSLPAGPYPIDLPLKASLAPGADPSELEFNGKLYQCFAADPSALPPSKHLRVTPRELAHACLGIDPKTYFTCQTDLEVEGEIAERDLPAGDDCARARTVASRLGSVLARRNTEWLNVTMRLVDEGQAVMAGVKTPANGGPLPIWYGQGLQWGGGHAVLVVGYVTYAELSSADEQHRGMLGEGIFDRLASIVDPEFKAKVDAQALPREPAGLRDARVGSKLGMLLKAEGGLLLFRNSWGTHVGETEIGIGGFQSMTFDFFLKSATLIQSRANARVQGIAWQRDAGPEHCPATSLPTHDPWLAADRSEDVAKFLSQLIVPPTCN